MNKLQNKLKELCACAEAIDWAKDFITFKEAWNVCERADWMLWIAGRLADKNDNQKAVVLCVCVCACARRSLKYVPNDENRPLIAIETAERWTRGEASLEDLRIAANTAELKAMSDIIREILPPPLKI